MTKTAEQIIDEWIDAGNLDSELDLDGFETIPNLPDGLKFFRADNAILLPELPESLEHLSANRTPLLPALPASLKTLSANSVKQLPKLPIGLEVVFAPRATNKADRLQEQREARDSVRGTPKPTRRPS